MLSSSNFEGGEEDRNNWILDLGLEIGNENWSYKSIYRSQLNFSTNNYIVEGWIKFEPPTTFTVLPSRH